MFKKFFNLLICIGLLMQSFLFAIPVMAEEIKEIDIIINGIYQGNNEAQLDGEGNYIIDKYDEVILDFSLKNENNSKDYYVQINSENNADSGYASMYRQKQEIYINRDKEIQKFEIKIFDTGDCQNLLATKTFNIKLDYFNEIKDSYILISNIKQGGVDLIGEEIEPGYRKVVLNNKQNIEFKITGINLIDDADYSVSAANNYMIYKGSELEEGINLVNYINVEQNSSFWVSTSMDGIRIDIPSKYSDGVSTYNNFNIEINDSYLPSFNTKMIYTNNEEKDIIKSDIEYRDYYIIDSDFHNENNSLTYVIEGNNYLDKDYLVSIEVKKGNTTVYGRGKRVNGLLLNEGYNWKLDDLVLELNKEEGMSAEIYSFYLNIDDVVSKEEYKYNSLGKDVYISSNIFFENGKKNLSAFRGNGNYFFSSGVFDTNKDVFNKFSAIYLRYMGDNFNSNETYDYTLEYGYFVDNSEVYDVRYEKVLEKGKVNGGIFNTIGLLFKVDNHRKYQNPTYKLTIKKEKRYYFQIHLYYIL